MFLNNRFEHFRKIVKQFYGHNSAPLRARDLGTSTNKVLEGEEFDFEV